MERAAKKDAVEALNGLFKTTSVAVVAHYSGLTVVQMQKLRMQMKQAGASVKVSKNRLAKIALEGTDVVAIGADRDRDFKRSGSGAEGCHRIRQDERAVRHSRRLDG